MEGDERQCRYCLEVASGAAEDELVAPCGCVGGQRWVHLRCLRAWQQSVLISQAPHLPPEADDVRARKCNICLKEFVYPPPCRHHLLRETVGIQLADMIQPSCLVLTSPHLSRELQNNLRANENRRTTSDFLHWCRSAFLVHKVAPRQVVLALPDAGSVDAAMQLVDADDLLVLHGRRYKVMCDEQGISLMTMASVQVPAPPSQEVEGSPQQAAQGSSEQSAARPSVYQVHRWLLLPGGEEANRAGGVRSCLALARGHVPARLRLEAEIGDFKEDAIMAVNLSRPVAESDLSNESQEIVRRARAAAVASLVLEAGSSSPETEVDAKSAVQSVRLQHFLGGPCEQTRCLVLSQSSSVIQAMDDDTGSRCSRARLLPGLDTVCSNNLAGFLAKAAAQMSRDRPDSVDGREYKRRRLWRKSKSDSIFTVKQTSAPCEPLFLFWGEARWSRTQLLAEIARQDWGLCSAAVDDLACAVSAPPSYAKLWQHLTQGAGDRRPEFAPDGPANERRRSAVAAAAAAI
eukprot:TRINITY_DN30189_c0_g1_i1.p1 TRINITY_DN30189_c0_g1~~TRINITY_DN30189_c0_g1_i1.p1  ORF type:complete len:518 (-),score=91.75 TRINITY_DN30189_c0_g1_i1:193-1746(-)